MRAKLGDMTDVTQILHQIEHGEAAASEELLPLAYDELRKLAAVRLTNEKPGQTLQATSLVHEAYVRLVDGVKQNQWDSRGHFFAAAAEAMRRILIDRARAKNRPKHGGDRQRMELEINCPAGNETPDRLLTIDEALEKLQSEHPQVVELLKLRYFAGVPLKDAADLLEISPATAKRRWAFARAFLYGELSE